MPDILLLNRATGDLLALEWLAVKKTIFPNKTDAELESGVYCGYVPMHPRDHQEQCQAGKPIAVLIGAAELAPAKEQATYALIEAAPLQLHIVLDGDKLVRLSIHNGRFVRQPMPSLEPASRSQPRSSPAREPVSAGKTGHRYGDPGPMGLDADDHGRNDL